MKNIIFLLFTSLLVSSLIVGCGGSSGDGDKKGGNTGTKNDTAKKDLVGKTPTISIPGGGLVSTTASAPKTGTEKPVVVPGCEDKDVVLPNCSK